MDFVSSSEPDSVIVSTGTSYDKKAHIHFKLFMDRTKYPSTGTNNSWPSFLIFDTAANNIVRSNLTLQPYQVVNYKIDSITGNNLVVTYSGMLTDSKLRTHTINGKFSCKLYTGSNEPNKFYCLIDSGKRAGYFISASLNANTLIMEGFDYIDVATMDIYRREFRILVRTGGTIKPGIYKSSDGDVSFISVVPPPVDLYSVVDTLGNMTVTIESVTGNVVRGTFSGTDQWRFPIDTGSFVCNVANYVPQHDAANRWKFAAWIDHAFGDYNCYAGNISNAVKTATNGRNYLTINGESDNGASVFKIVVSSTSPIIRGLYLIDGGPDNLLDSLYFKSGIATWDGTIPYLYSHQGTAGGGVETYCYIDYIDDKTVSGTFYGEIFDNLEDVIFGPGYSGARKIHKASFAANF